MKYAYDIGHRKKQLRKLHEVLKSRIGEVENALFQDLGKPAFEARISETAYVLSEIRLFLKHIEKWAAPEKVSASLLNFPSKDQIVKVPYGKVLVFAPWNYPFQLSLSPAIAAYAAGNAVVIKPSELSPFTARIIADLVASVFTEDEIQVVNGGADVASDLLSKTWDYIFFTGGTAIGKKVAEAAARNLTPTTLELGGKNPCLIDYNCNLELAARRIVWGKFFNAGQTCIAPDFVLLPSRIKSNFLELLKAAIIRSYGNDILSSTDYGRLINDHHAERLHGLLKGERIFFGGDYHREQKYLSPTLVDISSWDAALMQEEIFGPILPVIGYESEAERDRLLQGFSHSLAFYVFSEDTARADELVMRQPCGGACINDTVVHFANARLPFGGVGSSGYGAYHGKFGFDTFSHRKSILKRGNWLDPSLRYPPYSGKLKLISRILDWL